MNKVIICNWYHYVDFDGFHTIEMEFINNVTGAVRWKMYKAETRQKVQAKAKREETRIVNKAMRIYK